MWDGGVFAFDFIKIIDPPFQVDVHEAAGATASELSSLKAIVGKYNVSQDDLNKLLDWKHAH